MGNFRRINDACTMHSIEGESDAFRKFRYQFVQLFNPDEIAKTDKEFELLYVKDAKTERALSDFRRFPNSMAMCVVGYTGIGKSTSIRHCFSIGVKKTTFIDPVKKMLVFPTFLDGQKISEGETFDIFPRIRAVSTFLKETFPDDYAKLKTEAGKEELYNFIRRHTDYTLEAVDSVEELDWDRETLINEKLKSARKVFPYQYHANVIKYFLTKHLDIISNFVIILDDFETLPDEYVDGVLGSYLKLYECMKNTDNSEDSLYSIKIVLSMRPHTFRRHMLNNRRMESFGISRPFVKDTCVDINSIFENRFNYYSTKNPEPIREKETWEQCKSVLSDMNKQFDGVHLKMISRLCFYDVRKTLAWYSRVFANRFWVQNNLLKRPSFTLKKQDFDFSRVNVIRAVACRESNAYFEYPDGIVPNIFYSTYSEDLSILSVMVIKYFYRKTRFDNYGVEDATESVENTLQFWAGLCGNEYTNNVKKIIDYLFDRKILRKSIRNAEEYNSKNDHSSLRNDSALYISPSGMCLYEMLQDNSILLEMLRESAWRDYSVYNFSDLPSITLIQRGEKDQLYEELLEYVKYLYEQEDDIMNLIKAHKKTKDFIDIFGSESISQRMWQGVHNSMYVTKMLEANKDLAHKSHQIEKLTKSLY